MVLQKNHYKLYGLENFIVEYFNVYNSYLLIVLLIPIRFRDAKYIL